MLRTCTLWLAALLSVPLLSAQTPLSVTGLPLDAPVKLRAFATERVLLVDIEFLPQWHAYARDVGGGQPVGLQLAEGGDFQARSPLVVPDTTSGKLEGTVRLRLPIEQRAAGRELRATLELQVCDAMECLEPMSVQLSGTVKALSLLLVTEDDGERPERIAESLRARGFVVQRDSYEKVSLKTCDEHDVVIADSDLFQRPGASRLHIKRFPRTRSPILAVGFLGTEMVEHHGLAMTSGYI